MIQVLFFFVFFSFYLRLFRKQHQYHHELAALQPRRVFQRVHERARRQDRGR